MQEAETVRVLYMEDDPGLARLVQKHLQRGGYSVDTAENGEIGLDMVRTTLYDVVIVDHNMPIYSGLDVLREMEAEDSSPPVIMLTGAGSEDTAVAAMKSGAAEYIVKDTETEYLTILPSHIDRVLREHRLTQEKLVAEAALRQSEARYRTLFEQANDAILIEDAEGRIVNANLQACEMLGYDHEKLLSLSSCYLDADDADRESRATARAGAQADERRTYEATLRRFDGDSLPVEISISQLSDIQGDLYLSIVRDISERKEFEEKLRQMAHHDSLTGAFNRHYFAELIESEGARARRYGHPIGFLMIDVNRFKEINDRHSHQTGDAVLRRIAELIQETIRITDRLVRFGGDEFLVVLPETNGDSDFLRDRVVDRLKEVEFLKPEFGFEVTLSIGVAHWSPDTREPIEKALALADERMYIDKRSAHSSGTEALDLFES